MSEGIEASHKMFIPEFHAVDINDRTHAQEGNEIYTMTIVK